jgi:hypothetical protein
MHSNSGELENYKNRFSFPKNNFFCYKWRIKDHFSTSIDRQRFHLNVLGAGNDRSLMNDRIMGLYKSSFGSSRKDLVVNLANDAMAFLDRRRQQQKRVQESERALSQATAELAQHVFNILLAFSSELNSLMGLSEIFISANEPETRRLGSNKEGITTLLNQSSFSTCFYRLVVEGRLESLNFYLVPSDAVISMNEISLNYQPLERWQSKLQPNGSVHWYSGEHMLEGESVDVVCAELLRVLLESTQERLMPAEMMEVSRSIFELSAPAPWEVDATKRTADSGAGSNTSNCNTGNNAGYMGSEIVYSQPEYKEEKVELPFSNPALVDDIGLMTLYDIPCVGSPKAQPVQPAQPIQPYQQHSPAASTPENKAETLPDCQSWQSVGVETYGWADEPVEPMVIKAKREADAENIETIAAKTPAKKRAATKATAKTTNIKSGETSCEKPAGGKTTKAKAGAKSRK